MELMAGVPLLQEAERLGGVWTLPQGRRGVCEMRPCPLYTLLQVLKDMPIAADDLNAALKLPYKCNVPEILKRISQDKAVIADTRRLASAVRAKLFDVYNSTGVPTR